MLLRGIEVVGRARVAIPSTSLMLLSVACLNTPPQIAVEADTDRGKLREFKLVKLSTVVQ
jgi:hypothetical protein